MRSVRFCLISIVLVIFGAIIAIPSTQAQLADSPWPSGLQNAKNTALSPHQGPSNKPTLNWWYETDGIIYNNPVIGGEGKVFVSSETVTDFYSGTLYAINENGNLTWKYEVGETLSPPVISDNNNLYIGNREGVLISLNPEGTLRWKDTLFTRINYSPVLHDGHVLIAGNSFLRSLTIDGVESWKAKLGDNIETKPVLDDHDNLYICASSVTNKEENTYLFKLNEAGKSQWKKKVEGCNNITVGTKNNVYIGGYMGTLETQKLVSFTPEGEFRWEADSLLGPPSIGPNGNIFIGSYGGNIHRFGIDGSHHWETKVSDTSVGKLTIDRKGKVYGINLDNQATSLHPELFSLTTEGKIAWQIFTDLNLRTYPVIDNNSSLYVGSRDSALYKFTEVKTSINNRTLTAPQHIKLKTNIPNPFNPSTNLRFKLPQSEQVVLNVYNTIGQKIETLVNRRMTAGSHSVTFEAKGLPSGVYIYQLETGDFRKSRKMLLVK